MSTKKRLGTAGSAAALSAIAAVAPVAGQALSMFVSNLAGFWRNVRARTVFRRNDSASR